MLGEKDPWEAACWFAEAGPAVVVIKVGSKGSLIYDCDSGERWHIPPYPTDVVDVTGAGDTVIAVLTLAVAAGATFVARTTTYHVFQVRDYIARAIAHKGFSVVEAVSCQDARIVLVTSGTVTSTRRDVIRRLRQKGERVGLLKIKMFRPFPFDLIREHLGAVEKVAVIDRNVSFGACGIFAQEVRAALYGLPSRPLVFGYVAGLGGRDITPQTIEEVYHRTKKEPAPANDSIWIGLDEELVSPWHS